jgi:ribosomal protein S18 acetylase RimI-like enzyme
VDKTVEYDHIKFKNFESSDIQAAYELYKESFQEYIEKSFGWDEKFQINRFCKYNINDFQWITINKQNIGYICLAISDQSYHLHLIVIKSECRNIGLGKSIIKKIETMAYKRSVIIKLSSFKLNERANNFYKHLGYSFLEDDEHFYEITKSAQQGDAPEPETKADSASPASHPPGR